MPTEQENTLDMIMDRDPVELSDQDLDAIIGYQRKYRANLEAGGPKTKRTAKPGVKIDISALIKKPDAVAGTTIKRRL